MRRHSSRAALTVLAGTCAAALAMPAAQAAPAPASVLPATLTVECTGIGAVTVHTHGGRITGATTDAGPVTLGGAQVSVTSARGSATEGQVPATATACDPLLLKGVPASAVLGDAAAARLGATTPVQASLTFGAHADVDAVLAAAAHSPLRTASLRVAAVSNDPAGYGPVEAFPTTWGVQDYLDGAGSITAAYRGAGEKVIHAGTHGQATNVTASIVKVQIMATVMHQAQQQGRGLTAWEKSELVPMIHQSSNDAATALWNHVGGGPAVARVLALMGLRSTVPGSGSYWGLTVTSAPDQVVLVDHFARSNPVISDANRAYGLGLMRGVESDQDWGVTAGPGTDNAVKNGWLPRADGWHVNSVGYLDDAPRHYTMAVLSQSPSASMDTLVGRIQTVSRLVWNHQHGVRGDFTGDGRADLVGVRGGRVVLARGTGSGFGAFTPVSGGGWGAMKWLGSAGDLNGDGLSDLLAVRGNHLYAYRTSGGAIGAGTDLGAGWGGFTALAGVANLDGSGAPEIVGRDGNGVLYLYRTHGFSAPTLVGRIGHGWGSMRAIVGSGDFNNDGRGDLLSVDSAGNLLAWNSTGRGLAAIGRRGSGWRGTLAGPGDADGNEVGDAVLQRGASAWFYPIAGGGAVTGSAGLGSSTAGITHLA